jgi:hypothetical protein
MFSSVKSTSREQGSLKFIPKRIKKKINNLGKPDLVNFMCINVHTYNFDYKQITNHTVTL